MKVNDYIRTKDGLIRKIVEIDKLIYIDKDYISDEPEYHNSLIEEDVIKTSSNIIDLIEVGDYVNGFEVLRIDKECNLYPKTLKCQYPNNTDYFDMFNENIKSIVTKEQFESMEYKVGE